MKKWTFIGLCIFAVGVGSLYLSFWIMVNGDSWHTPIDGILSLMGGVLGLGVGAGMAIYNQFIKDTLM